MKDDMTQEEFNRLTKELVEQLKNAKLELEHKQFKMEKLLEGDQWPHLEHNLPSVLRQLGQGKARGIYVAGAIDYYIEKMGGHPDKSD